MLQVAGNLSIIKVDGTSKAPKKCVFSQKMRPLKIDLICTQQLSIYLESF